MIELPCKITGCKFVARATTMRRALDDLDRHMNDEHEFEKSILDV